MIGQQQDNHELPDHSTVAKPFNSPGAGSVRVPGLECHHLDEKHVLYSAQLPETLRFSADQYEQVWAMHPSEYHEIMIHGRLVPTPRWQQAYGRDYQYTGQVNRALPVPSLLQPLLDWSQMLDARLNGLLLNWYDGARGHYIGKHRDSIANLRRGSPIVTISFGEERVFRLRPHKGTGMIDFRAKNGTVFVMPFATNLAWTHEVPKSSRCLGRRISVTVRAFVND